MTRVIMHVLLQLLSAVLVCLILNVDGYATDRLNARVPSNNKSKQKSKSKKDTTPYTIIVTGVKDILPNEYSTDVIDAGTMKDSGTDNVASLLKDNNSVNVTTGSKGEQSVNIRGFEQRQTVILLDGIPIYDPYNYKIDLGKFPNDFISKIVLSKGVSSVLYGPNAMGGVINIISRQGYHEPVFNLLSELSFFDSDQILNQRHVASYSIGTEKYSVYASFGTIWKQGDYLSRTYEQQRNQDTGMRVNSQRFEWNTLLNVKYRPSDEHEFAVTANVIDGKFGIPPHAEEISPRYIKFTFWRNYLTTICNKWQASKQFSLSSAAFYSRNDNILSFYEDADYKDLLASLPPSHYYDSRYGFIMYPVLKLHKDNTIKMSVHAKKDKHESWKEVTDYRSMHYAEIYSFGIEDSLRVFNQWTVLLGISYDRMVPHSNNRGPLNTYNPIIGLQFDNKLGNFYFTGGLKSRFPTLKEMYSTITNTSETTLPNQYLNSEKVQIVDIGFNINPKLLSKVRKFKISLFYNKMTDLIESIYLPSGEKIWANINKAHSYGVEFSASMNPLKNLYVHPSYTYLHAYKDLSDGTVKRLEYRPTHKKVIRVNYLFPSAIKGTLKFLYVSDQYYQPNYLTTKKLKDYYLFDVRVSKLFKNDWEVYAMVKNLLDKNYQTRYGFPEAGRNYIIGTQVKF